MFEDTLVNNHAYIYKDSRVDFANILCAAFTCEDPKSAENNDCMTVFFALLESSCVKVAHKMLVKSTITLPGVKGLVELAL